MTDLFVQWKVSRKISSLAYPQPVAEPGSAGGLSPILLPQDGSNIGDVLQALWWMSEMKWERPIYGGTTDFMSTFRFAGTACLACLNGTPLFKCYCLLLLCCASYMLEYCNRSFIYNCTMNTLVCWGCKQRVGHFLITKQISPCSHWQKKAREKSTHSTILAINQPIGFNI